MMVGGEAGSGFPEFVEDCRRWENKVDIIFGEGGVGGGYNSGLGELEDAWREPLGKLRLLWERFFLYQGCLAVQFIFLYFGRFSNKNFEFAYYFFAITIIVIAYDRV